MLFACSAGMENVETRPLIAVFRKGFRPFFLLGALVAASMLVAWLMVLFGGVTPRTTFAPIYWHAHEMIFGFAVAVIAGFLLTAVGNWTQRETALGTKLFFLAALFVAGRFAVSFAALLPRFVPLAVDAAFLPLLAVVLALPIVATRNFRNLTVVLAVLALGAANLMTHLGALGIAPDWQRRGGIVGVDVVIFMCSLIAGRVFPMFTRNATRQESIHGSPRLDVAAMVGVAALTLLDACGVEHPAQGVLFVLVSALLVVRGWHWGARHSARVPLLWVLHLGYAWICAGFFLRGVATFTWRVPATLGLHALTVGAAGSLTLGMIARVSLGHTGRLLEPPRSVVLGFVLVSLAAIVRVLFPLANAEWTRPALLVSGTLLASSFVLFLVGYARILVTAREDGKAG